MSQAGLVDIESAVPAIPTTFDTDSGSAVPVLNTLEILGGTGVTTSASGNTVTITANNLGDVVGPSSAINGNLPSFDGTTGKLIDDSGVVADNVVTAVASLTQYSVICGDASTKGVQALASVGTSGQVLTSNGIGTLPTWENAGGGDVVGPASAVNDNAIARWDTTTGKLLQNSNVIIDDSNNISGGTWQGTAVSEVYGGTNQTTYATGDILFASASNTLSKLAAGTDGNVLTLASGVPAWSAPTGSSGYKNAFMFGGM